MSYFRYGISERFQLVLMFGVALGVIAAIYGVVNRSISQAQENAERDTACRLACGHLAVEYKYDNPDGKLCCVCLTEEGPIVRVMK